jgi:hypothetical protein|nr:hypothetical protein [Butyrivibrio sp.]
MKSIKRLKSMAMIYIQPVPANPLKTLYRPSGKFEKATHKIEIKEKNKMKVDPKMIEMADIYHLSFMTRVKYIYLPALFPNMYKNRLNKGNKVEESM